MTVVNGVLGLAGPLAILLGQVWEDLFAAISLGQIAVRAGEPLTASAVQRCRRCARGSTVRLALWDARARGLVDVDGEPVELPRARRCAA